MSAQMLKVSLLGVGTVLRVERGARSMVKHDQGKQHMSAPSPPPLSYHLPRVLHRVGYR